MPQANKTYVRRYWPAVYMALDEADLDYEEMMLMALATIAAEAGDFDLPQDVLGLGPLERNVGILDDAAAVRPAEAGPIGGAEDGVRSTQDGEQEGGANEGRHGG